MVAACLQEGSAGVVVAELALQLGKPAAASVPQPAVQLTLQPGDAVVTCGPQPAAVQKLQLQLLLLLAVSCNRHVT